MNTIGKIQEGGIWHIWVDRAREHQASDCDRRMFLGRLDPEGFRFPCPKSPVHTSHTLLRHDDVRYLEYLTHPR